VRAGPWARRLGQVEIGGVILIILCISLIPYRYLSVDGIPSFPIHFFPLCTIAILLVSIVARGMPVVQILKTDPLILPIVAVLTIDVLSALGGITAYWSLQKVAYYSLTGPLVYLLIRIKLFERQDNRGILLWAISGTSALAALYGLSEFWVGGNWLFGKFFALGNPSYAAMVGEAVFTDRVMGTVGHPVAFGAFLLLCLPTGVFLACQSGNMRKLVGIAISAVVVMGIFLTLSRGAWAGLLAAVLFYCVYQKRRLTVIILGSLVVLLVVMVSSERLLTSVKSRNPYSQYVENFRENSRVKAYSYVAQILPQFVYWGSGTGTYHLLAKPRGSFLNTPDNMYLMRLVETGVIGMIAWLFLFQKGARVLVASSRPAEGDPPDRFPALLLAGLVGFLVDMCTFDALYFPATRIMFWMLLAIGCSSARKGFERD